MDAPAGIADPGVATKVVLCCFSRLLYAPMIRIRYQSKRGEILS